MLWLIRLFALIAEVRTRLNFAFVIHLVVRLFETAISKSRECLTLVRHRRKYV